MNIIGTTYPQLFNIILGSFQVLLSQLGHFVLLIKVNYIYSQCQVIMSNTTGAL